MDLPLIRTDDDASLTPLDRTTAACEQLITALMVAGSLNDPRASEQERELYTTLSVATIVPAEA